MKEKKEYFEPTVKLAEMDETPLCDGGSEFAPPVEEEVDFGAKEVKFEKEVGE